MADGFLGRWAKRKEAVRQGKDLPAEPVKELAPLPSPQPSPAGGRGSNIAPLSPAGIPPSPPGGEGRGEEAAAEQAPSPLTLQDAESLTKDSDFTRFVRPDVDPAVKNAALRKLFTDPHFNVMDGLDVYIDDYSKPDPMPPEMVKELLGAKFLRMFEEKETEADAEAKLPTESANADVPPPESVAQSSSRTEHALPPAEDHADPDLRLQQDDAPGRPGPGAGSR